MSSFLCSSLIVPCLSHSDDIQTFDTWSLFLLHHLWSYGRGAVILSSFSVANTESNASWSFDTYEEPRGSEARHQISGKNALIEMFFQRFSDPARFSCFQLLPLEAPAMTEFLQEYFEIDETNYVIDPYEFEKILDACGGIPLYAIELMKPLLAKCKCSSGAAQKKDKSGLSHEPSSAAMVEKMPTFHQRIEEVICYRLDKLDPTVQTLLKAAAVAASNSCFFTVEIVSFLLKGQPDQHMDISEKNPARFQLHHRLSSLKGGVSFKEGGSLKFLSVSDALLELIQSGVFLQLRGGENISRDLDDDANSNALSSKYIEGKLLEFEIPVEQTTIYNMLVDDQKEYFHEKLAFYLTNKFSAHLLRQERNDSSRSSKPLETIFQERLEEAFHWEKSYLFPNGVLAAMVAGDFFKNTMNHEFRWVDAMKAAFKNFQFLENDMNFRLQPVAVDAETLSFLLQCSRADYQFPVSRLHGLFSKYHEQITQVLVYLEGFMDYLPVFMKLLQNILDIAIYELDDLQVIEYLLGLNFAFVLTFYYLHVYLSLKDTANNKSNNNNACEEEKVISLFSVHFLVFPNISSDDEEKDYDEQQQEDKFVNDPSMPITAFTSPYSLRSTYQRYSRELFEYHQTDLSHLLHSTLLAHLFSFPRQSHFIPVVIQREASLTLIIEEFSSKAKNTKTENDNAVFFQSTAASFRLLRDFYFANQSLRSIESREAIESLVSSYQSHSPAFQSIAKKHCNFNWIPLLLEVLAMDALYRGDYSLFLKIHQATRTPSAITPSDESDASLMFQGHGLTVINDFLLFLVLEQPGSSYIIWQDYLLSLLDKEKMMKIFPFVWKRNIDTTLRKLFLLSKGFLSATTSMDAIEMPQRHQQQHSAPKQQQPVVAASSPVKRRKHGSVYGIFHSTASNTAAAAMSSHHPAATLFQQKFSELEIAMNDYFRAYYLSAESMNFILVFCQLIEELLTATSTATGQQQDLLLSQLKQLWAYLVSASQRDLNSNSEASNNKFQKFLNPLNFLIPISLLANYFASVYAQEQQHQQQQQRLFSPTSEQKKRILSLFQQDFSFLFQSIQEDLIPLIRYFIDDRHYHLVTSFLLRDIQILFLLHEKQKSSPFIQTLADLSTSCSTSLTCLPSNGNPSFNFSSTESPNLPQGKVPEFKEFLLKQLLPTAEQPLSQ